GAFRLSDPWTLFVREQVFLSDPASGSTAARAEGLFGTAYRPLTGPFQFLLRIDDTLADGRPITSGGVTPGGIASQPAASPAPPPRDPRQPRPGPDSPRYGPFATRDSGASTFAAGFRIDARNRLASTLVFKHAGPEADTGIPGSTTWLLSLHYTAWVKE